MRFKATLATEQVQILHNIITPLIKISTTSDSSSSSLHNNTSTLLSSRPQSSIFTNTVYGGGTIIILDPTSLRISTRSRCCEDGSISSFIDLSTEKNNGIFLDQCIESVADNMIVFEIDVSQLKIALQSILEGGKIRSIVHTPLCQSQNDSAETSQKKKERHYTTSMIIMKLAKRNEIPCLCIDAAMSGGSVEVHHAIPVRMMRAADVDLHLPPEIGLPNVALELPLERPLKNVMERLKSVSPFVFIEGNMNGDLTLRVDTDGISLRTFYYNLSPRAGGETHPSKRQCIVKVDSKKLYNCLQWQAIMPIGRGLVMSASICLLENEMLVLHMDLSFTGFFTYYLPVHFISPDMFD